MTRLEMQNEILDVFPAHEGHILSQGGLKFDCDRCKLLMNLDNMRIKDIWLLIKKLRTEK